MAGLTKLIQCAHWLDSLAISRRPAHSVGTFATSIPLKMTPKSKATLEALHALFAPVQATVYLATVAEPVTIPDNLDAQISADEATTLDTPMFRWYRGTDAKGIVRVFRFQRGHTLAQWRE